MMLKARVCGGGEKTPRLEEQRSFTFSVRNAIFEYGLRSGTDLYDAARLDADSDPSYAAVTRQPLSGLDMFGMRCNPFRRLTYY